MNKTTALPPPLLTVNVRYDYESFLAYWRFSMFRGPGPDWLKTGLRVLWLLLGVILFVIGVRMTDLAYTALGAILLTALAVVMIRFFWWPGVHYKRAGALYGGDLWLAFFPAFLEVVGGGRLAKSLATYEYGAFSAVYETAGAFYLYLLNGTCFLIPKKYLRPDEPDRLETHLRRVFGGRYRSR
ncbi:MAG: YcxB family protein [Oscillospiraceae bacterium]|jgi:hypothetical protein|nr:YcxB family protein [Oscillospiraceae bacterium]